MRACSALRRARRGCAAAHAQRSAACTAEPARRLLAHSNSPTTRLLPHEGFVHFTAGYDAAVTGGLFTKKTFLQRFYPDFRGRKDTPYCQ